MIEYPRATSRRSGRKALAALSALALAAAGFTALGALPASAAPSPALAGGIVGKGQTVFEAGRYVVTLAEDAAATYQGGVDGMAPTQPDTGDQLNAKRQAVQTYSEYLTDQQDDIAATVGASVEYSYTLALNGFSTTLTAAQAAQLANDKRVVALERDELKKITAVPSTDFLGLSGPDGVWAATGGVETAGEGTVLGVLDTGIAPENPSFAGEPLGTAPGADPYYSSRGVTSYDKADGSTFTGRCEQGVQFSLADCSTKIVGAQYFVDGFQANRIGSPATGEYLSPRDGDGHGSHTGSTAVGNIGIDAGVGGQQFAQITGVAPAAKIAAYKVCWSGPDNAATTDDGCATTDLLAAIDASVDDGVDAINFSIGGGAATSTVTATDQAFLGAAAAGIFVAASAGNAGPTSSTLDNASPWITTVAASTIPSYEATARLGNGEEYAGASITVDLTEGAEPLTGPLVLSDAVALPGATTPELCIAGSLDPALAAGNIVVCDRGVNDRVAKSAEVARAGGIGMILTNVTPSSIDLDNHSVPTVHVDAPYRDAIRAYAATPGATATFLPENTTGITPPTPQIAGFSSRGPALADGSDILKPDISAPGVAILAASANPENGEPTFAFLSGTSMAAPHIAGLAVLYLGESPNATPAEIKSAMMTTAYDLVDGDGDPVTDPFIQGAGHVDPTEFFSPGLLYLNGIDDWLSYIEGVGYDVIDPAVQPIDASNLNLASIAIGTLTAPETITRTVTSTQAGTFTASIQGLEGIDAQVEPATLEFGAAGESQQYTVTFNRTDAAVNEFATGSLTWTSGETEVRSPIAVQPVDVVAPAEVSGTGVTGSTDITVTPGVTGEIPLTSTGLSAGVLQPDPTGTETEHSGSGVTGDSFEYTVEVPEGLPVARFDLDALDDSTDLDLVVYLLDDAGNPVLGYQSATASADERVTIAEPDAGTYLVVVDVYTSPTPSAFDLFSYLVAPEGEPITFVPPAIQAEQGVETTFAATWTGLEPLTRYLGVIGYGDTAATTFLTVTTGEDDGGGEQPEPVAPINTVPPTISGTPLVGSTLTATSGEWDTEGLAFTYQWQADGQDIAGATGETYRVAVDDQGRAITVTVTASAEGVPSTTAISDAVTIIYRSTTTLSLSRSVYFSWQSSTATVTVDTVDDAAPAGTVRVVIDGRVSGRVPVEVGSNGTVQYRLPSLRPGFHSVQARFIPDDANVVRGSASTTKTVWLVF